MINVLLEIINIFDVSYCLNFSHILDEISTCLAFDLSADSFIYNYW